jgi:hypothetical protein
VGAIELVLAELAEALDIGGGVAVGDEAEGLPASEPEAEVEGGRRSPRSGCGFRWNLRRLSRAHPENGAMLRHFEIRSH